MNMQLKPLDVCFYTGHGITSKVIRLLTSIRYGIPFKECRSHVDIRYNNDKNISAEPEGTVLVNFEDSLKHNDVTVYRFRKLPDLNLFYEIADKLLGRKYAYARYFLDASRIFSFVFGVSGTVLSLFNWKVNAGFFIALLILQFASIWLRKVDAQTYDCSETSSTILTGLNLLSSISSKLRNEFPNSIESQMKLLVKNGLVDVVFIHLVK